MNSTVSGYDLTPLIQASNFDTSIFDPALVAFYQTEEGQVGLPFGIFPGGMFFIPAMFDEQGLSYPPQKYGEKYKMPDGTMVDWNWDTVTKIAKLLTVDKNGKNSTEAGFDSNPDRADWLHPAVPERPIHRHLLRRRQLDLLRRQGCLESCHPRQLESCLAMVL